MHNMDKAPHKKCSSRLTALTFGKKVAAGNPSPTTAVTATTAEAVMTTVAHQATARNKMDGTTAMTAAEATATEPMATTGTTAARSSTGPTTTAETTTSTAGAAAQNVAKVHDDQRTKSPHSNSPHQCPNCPTCL